MEQLDNLHDLCCGKRNDDRTCRRFFRCAIIAFIRIKMLSQRDRRTNSPRRLIVPSYSSERRFVGTRIRCYTRCWLGINAPPATMLGQISRHLFMVAKETCARFYEGNVKTPFASPATTITVVVFSWRHTSRGTRESLLVIRVYRNSRRGLRSIRRMFIEIFFKVYERSKRGERLLCN